MALKPEERGRIHDVVTAIYADGYAAAVSRVADEYELFEFVRGATERIGGAVSARLDLVDKAVESYIDLLEKKAREIRATGARPERVFAEVEQYARYLAEDKGQLVAEMEWAKGSLDGAGNIVDESGEAFEWRFPHFETAAPDHEECEICEAIREGSPYSTAEAEANDYPDLPHPNCDHGWVLVPKGEESRTEEFPQGPALSA
jgi:hypothetical protein